MKELTLSDVRTFNADVMTVNAAGVPLNLGFDSPMGQAQLQAELHRLEATLTTMSAGEAPVYDMLMHNPQFPTQYVSTLQHWFDVQGAPRAFDPSSAASASERRRWGALAIDFVHPASWLCLAYVAMVIVCGGLVPMFEAQNRQMSATPGPVLSILLGLRDWMPVWSIAFPAMVAVGIGALYRLRQSRASRQPSGLSQPEALRRAQLAEQASRMLAQGMSGQQVIKVLHERAQACRSALRLDSTGNTVPPSETLPPLLKWASSHIPLEVAELAFPSAGSLEAPDAFQRAAGIYGGIAQQLDQHRVARRPLRIVIIVAGGLLVLGVALSIFGPLVEMLLYLAAPTTD